MEGNEELTPLGHHLSKLPVDVLIGKVSSINPKFAGWPTNKVDRNLKFINF